MTNPSLILVLMVVDWASGQGQLQVQQAFPFRQQQSRNSERTVRMKQKSMPDDRLDKVLRYTNKALDEHNSTRSFNDYFAICNQIFEALQNEEGGTWTCIAGAPESFSHYTHWFTNWYAHFTLDDQHRFIIYKGAQAIPLKPCKNECGTQEAKVKELEELGATKDEKISELEGEKKALEKEKNTAIRESSGLKQELADLKLELKAMKLEQLTEGVSAAQARREAEEARLQAVVAQRKAAEASQKNAELERQIQELRTKMEAANESFNFEDIDLFMVKHLAGGFLGKIFFKKKQKEEAGEQEQIQGPEHKQKEEAEEKKQEEQPQQTKLKNQTGKNEEETGKVKKGESLKRPSVHVRWSSDSPADARDSSDRGARGDQNLPMEQQIENIQKKLQDKRVYRIREDGDRRTIDRKSSHHWKKIRCFNKLCEEDEAAVDALFQSPSLEALRHKDGSVPIGRILFEQKMEKRSRSQGPPTGDMESAYAIAKEQPCLNVAEKTARRHPRPKIHF
ncbi:unnamed protein product [Cyprideis torosa]|uniref:Uncharacterized protein n=1 Tax=Cyprideis torosa TaxID=163714 RepID=A0A7R8WPK5_9CRUS|nr:unnamed protein product [Cyprideis torosa]CAG0901639.1 unnamed protein product [Cyprideis torosa]